jgi:hypothetical protein
MALSPRDEQVLAARPVKLALLVPAGTAAKPGESASIDELRLGPVRPRPELMGLPEGND